MKKKIRFLNQLLIFGIIFMLYSCEKDLYEEGLKESGKSIIQKVNLEQIPIIKQSIEDKKSKISLTSKENASIYLDLINSESINVLTQSDGLKSYTFSLNIEETNLMTNLVIQETSNDLEYYLIKYSSVNIDQWKSDLINKVVSEIIPSIDFQELDAPVTNLTQNKICTEVTTFWVCPSGYHLWGEQGMCDFGFDEWILQTTFTDLNCGGTSNGSSNPNPGGGAISLQPQKEPCENLKRKLSPTEANLKPTILVMQATLNQPGENMAPLIKDATTNTYFPPVLAPPNSTLYQTLQTASQIYGAIHTHPWSGTPMFSFNDVYALYDIYQNTATANENEVTQILVVEYSPGVYETYAITILDPDTLFNAINNAFATVSGSTDKERIDALDLVLGLKYEKDTNYERTFLQHFAGFGISLFKADHNLTKWDELTCMESDLINPNPQVQKKPCN